MPRPATVPMMRLAIALAAILPMPAFAHTGPGKARRLNVALDTRLYFVSAGGESITMKHVAVSIGYDRL